MTLRRRRVLLGAAACVALPAAALAQPAGRMARVAIVFNGSRDSQKLATEAFVRGMAAQGYVEGRNLELDLRYAEGRMDEVPAILRGVLERKPDVIVLSGSQAIWAARRASSAVPIVMSSVGNPVEQGLIESLARPGGNLTGLALLAETVAAKRIELLHEVLPKAKRVARLFNSDNPGSAAAGREEAAAAARLGIELQAFDARSAAELDRALAAMAHARLQAVTVSEDALFASHGEKLVAAFAREKIASAYGWPQLVLLGGLMSYAADTRDQFAKSAAYVRRILQGAKPAEMPVEQATRFELFVNLKAARALGIAVPQAVLLRADSVID